MRVFLDTNVLVSAFATRGLCADLFEPILLQHELVCGKAVLAELDRSLRQKIKVPPARAKEISAFVTEEATLVVAKAAPADAPVDAPDALVLGEALAAHADVFVTGDAALIRLTRVGAMPIVSPRQFWEKLQSSPSSA